MVVYVHGYYVDIDAAWHEHNLAQQFAASRRNALFIAPEAPAAPRESSPGRAATPAGDGAARGAGGTPPRPAGGGGPLRRLPHPGSLAGGPPLHHIILIDALYGNEPDFRDWLARERANHMTLAINGTAKWANPFVRTLPYAVTVPHIPRSIDS